MTMQHPSHPDDERLAALAASEQDAVADADLTTHVATCSRCAPLVDELRTLRSALAELPDIRPSRPLRFLPPVPAPAPARAGRLGLLRRLTAPAMAAAAVMILVGAIGSAGSIGFAGGAAGAGASLDRLAAGASSAATPSSADAGQDKGANGGVSVPAVGRSANPSASTREGFGAFSSSQPPTPAESAPLGTSRPPYEWLLGFGVVLLAAAFLARGYVSRRAVA
jgi:hypothetical protein